MREENIKLTDLIDTSILQKMQEAFAKMARMAALTTDENGIPLTSPSNFTELCTEYCRKSPIGCKRCEECDRMGARASMEQSRPLAYYCHAGLVDFAAPIMLGDRMLGSFIGGQILSSPPEKEKMLQVARELEVDEDAFWEAALKTQVIPQAAIERSTEFIYELARIISDMAYTAYASRRLSKEATELAHHKADFLANMSHEIRTPMNAVLGMAQLALREEMSPEARQYLQQIQTSGKHLLAIINDILDYSKIDSGKMELIEDYYATEHLLRNIIAVINNRIGDKNLEFIVDIPYDLPRELYGDAVRIQQIIINLLTNAVKFTKEGSITLRVGYYEYSATQVRLWLEIEDTGMGIKKEELGFLFMSFYQLDSKRNRNIEGTGLGLTITKQLVDLMKGDIKVRSEYGSGSIFRVELPQQRRDNKVIKLKPQEGVLYSYIQNKYVTEYLMRSLAQTKFYLKELVDEKISRLEPGSYCIMERELVEDSILELAKSQPDTTFILIEKYNADKDLQAENIICLRKPVDRILLYRALGILEANSEDNLQEEERFDFIAPEVKLMIVDDNRVNLSVAKGLLEPLQMQIATADGAEKGIERLGKEKFDMILMDHMMPKIDGIEATHIIRRMLPGYQEVPIIALTANVAGDAKQMYLQEGMNDFIPKPIEMDTMLKVIHRWLPPEKIIRVDVAGAEKAREQVKTREKERQTIEEPKPGTGDRSGAAQANVQKNTQANVQKNAQANTQANTSPQSQIIDFASGVRSLGSEKLYHTILREFYESLEAQRQKILGALREKDYSTYAIQVHSLKSLSKQIGAANISGLAARLEIAANAKQEVQLEKDTPALMHAYENLKTAIEKYLGIASPGPKEPQKTVSTDVLIKQLQAVLAALEEIDSLAIEEALAPMEKNHYASEQQIQYWNQLKASIEEFEIEQSIEYVRQWLQDML